LDYRLVVFEHTHPDVSGSLLLWWSALPGHRA